MLRRFRLGLDRPTVLSFLSATSLRALRPPAKVARVRLSGPPRICCGGAGSRSCLLPPRPFSLLFHYLALYAHLHRQCNSAPKTVKKQLRPEPLRTPALFYAL